MNKIKNLTERFGVSSGYIYLLVELTIAAADCEKVECSQLQIRLVRTMEKRVRINCKLCFFPFGIFVKYIQRLKIIERCLIMFNYRNFLTMLSSQVHDLESLLKANGTGRDSSGSIVSDFGLDDRGSIPDRDRGFFF
jgi:hypothetical protein